MSAGVNARALADLAARLAALEASVPRTAAALLAARADLVRRVLADTTPRRTGAAAAGWRVEALGPLSLAVVNEVRSRRGFAYPSALITGTGRRGVLTTGYTGAFKTAWPGMAPAERLHADWQFFTTQPFVTGAFLTRS